MVHPLLHIILGVSGTKRKYIGPMIQVKSIRSVQATRYVTPLGEGGSLPAIVESDDDGTYVLKFRGAGQGAKALIAELIAGEMARALGLPVPELVFMELDVDLARTEPDEEIQDLIRASGGTNLAMDYLPGSVSFDPVVDTIDAELASRIVWFDALMTNVDRTARNVNMLMWHRKLWLIDHGACLYFHHSWSNHTARSADAFPQIRDHVLLPIAGQLDKVDREMKDRLTPDITRKIVDQIPEAWLRGGESPFEAVSEHRDAYVRYLLDRLASTEPFLEEANRARSTSI